MNFRKISSSIITAALFAVTPMMAQDKNAPQKPAETQPAAPAPAKLDIDELLKSIPENLAKYGDNQFISNTELKNILSFQLTMAAQNGQTITKEMLNQIIPRMAEDFAMQEILILEAAKQGIKPDPEEIKKDIFELKKNPNGAQRIKMLMEEFKSKNEEVFIAKQARMVTAQKLLKQEIEKIAIPEEEVKKFYDDNPDLFTQLEASHILAAFSADMTKAPSKEQEEAALKKIQDIQKKLKDGGKFEDLAKEHSDCPSKAQGGSLGKFGKGQMVPEFEKALLTLKPDQISEPVKTQFGYHLIKAGNSQTIPFKDVKDRIADNLKQNKASEFVNKYVENLKKAYKVEMLVKPQAPIQPVEDK